MSFIDCYFFELELYKIQLNHTGFVKQTEKDQLKLFGPFKQHVNMKENSSETFKVRYNNCIVIIHLTVTVRSSMSGITQRSN